MQQPRILGSVGAGRAEIQSSPPGTRDTVYARAIDFRSLIARRFGLKAGVDLAVGSGGDALDIQIGAARR